MGERHMVNTALSGSQHRRRAAACLIEPLTLKLDRVQTERREIEWEKK